MRRAIRVQADGCDVRHVPDGKGYRRVAIGPRGALDKMMRTEDAMLKALDAMREAVRDTSQLIRDIQHKGIK